MCLNALENDVDIVVTASPSSRNPWFNMVTKNESNFFTLVNPQKSFTRRQDSPSCYDLATVAYVTRPSFIINSNSIWDGAVRAVTVPPHTAIDIDNFFDYSIAKLLLETPGLFAQLDDH